MTAAQRRIEAAAGMVIAARLIARFEGGQGTDGRFHPYWDQHGQVWTQGYGHTHGVTRHSKPWSKAKAIRVLAHDLARVYGKALLEQQLPLKRHMFAAVLSFIYNLGVGMLDESHDLGRELHAHHWRKAADAMPEYATSGGVRLLGLERRRDAERRLFLKDL